MPNPDDNERRRGRPSAGLTDRDVAAVISEKRLEAEVIRLDVPTPTVEVATSVPP